MYLFPIINTYLSYSSFEGFSAVSQFTNGKKNTLLNELSMQRSAPSTVTDPHVAVQVEVQTHSGEDQSPGEKWEVLRNEIPDSSK